MITEEVINFFLTVFAGVLGILPSLEFDTSGFDSACISISSLLQSLNFFLPVNDILSVLAAIVVYQGGGFLIWAINWVVRRIADIIP